MDTEIKRKVGRPRIIKEVVPKRPQGKPKNTKNGYNKKYKWAVYEGDKEVEYYNNINDISKKYGFTQSKITRVIYDNSKIKEIQNFTIKKVYNYEFDVEVIADEHHEVAAQQDVIHSVCVEYSS